MEGTDEKPPPAEGDEQVSEKQGEQQQEDTHQVEDADKPSADEQPAKGSSRSGKTDSSTIYWWWWEPVGLRLHSALLSQFCWKHGIVVVGI